MSEALTNGQQYADDYTKGADTARMAASWLDNGPNRNAVYTLVRDALNERDAVIDRLLSALTLDGDTKAAYMGDMTARMAMVRKEAGL